MTDSSESYSSSMAPRVMRLLSELDRSPAGQTIRDHVQDVLEAYEGEVTDARDSGLALAQALLDAWLNRLPEDAPGAAELRMLRLRLEQPPGRGESASLLRRIHALSVTAPSPLPGHPLEETVSRAEPVALRPEATQDAHGAVVSAGTWAPASDEASREHPSEPETGPDSSEASPESHPDTAVVAPPDDWSDRGQQIDVTHRKHLAEKRERIQKIQETLVEQVNDVIKQNEKFGVLLEVEHESLRHADSMEELEGLKSALVNEVGKLRNGHQTLARKLDTASKYLHIIGTEGQHLNEELTRAHILSLTDELTDLPNRRAFLRRLEDEVARVQRYGYPLSLALIDMDSFKSINDKYGHGAGDEVLRNFSTNVLSIFRHHDMVARYGGEEFAVVLPNTDKVGAQRALEKVKKRTMESSYQFGGKTMAMPTFSAGISLYKPGETPGNLIERADKALYQAKRLGRNRIELAQHDGAEASVR